MQFYFGNSIRLKSENNGSERVIKKRLSTGLRIITKCRRKVDQKQFHVNHIKQKKASNTAYTQNRKKQHAAPQ